MFHTASPSKLPSLLTLLELQIPSGTSTILPLGLVISIFFLALVVLVTGFVVFGGFLVLFLFNHRFWPLKLFKALLRDRHIVYEEAYFANFVIINAVMGV